MRQRREVPFGHLNTVVHLTYFDEQGRYFTEFDYSVRVPITDQRGTVDIDWVVDHIRGLRDGIGRLPGLNIPEKGWSGLILVDHEDGYPRVFLLKPRVPVKAPKKEKKNAGILRFPDQSADDTSPLS
mgnify:FL=1